MKKKMILDVIMTAIMLLLMKIAFTGITLHELLGLGVFIMFFVHKFFNRKWIKAISLKLFSKNLPIKTKVMYAIDVLLLILVTLTIISGILISQVLFTQFNADDISFWSNWHHFAAYSSLVLISIHIGMHWQSIMNMVKKALQLSDKNSVRTFVSRTFAALIMFFGLKVLIRDDISSNFTAPFSSDNESEKLTTVSVSHSSDNTISATQLSTATQLSSDVPTLEDYLGKLVCTGCGRRCPLTALSCSRGNKYKEAAIEEYNEQYSSTKSSNSAEDDSPSSSDENKSATGKSSENDDSPSASDDTSSNESAPLDYILLMGLFVAGTHYVITIPKYLK